MLPNIHGQELIWLFLIILLLFGGKKLPALANSIGRAVKDFKSGLSGIDQEMEAAERAEAKAAEEKVTAEKSETAAEPVVQVVEKAD